jgi:hypothetical protein
MKKRERRRQGEGGRKKVKPHDDQVRCVWWERCGGGDKLWTCCEKLGHGVGAGEKFLR